MSDPRPKSRDLGAALTGLVLGGSTLFLLVLTIVWLTNRHFDAKKAAEHAAKNFSKTKAFNCTVQPKPRE